MPPPPHRRYQKICPYYLFYRPNQRTSIYPRSTQRHDKYFKANMIHPSMVGYAFRFLFFSSFFSFGFKNHGIRLMKKCIVRKLKTSLVVENFPGEKFQPFMHRELLSIHVHVQCTQQRIISPSMNDVIISSGRKSKKKYTPSS